MEWRLDCPPHGGEGWGCSSEPLTDLQPALRRILPPMKIQGGKSLLRFEFSKQEIFLEMILFNGGVGGGGFFQCCGKCAIRSPGTYTAPPPLPLHAVKNPPFQGPWWNLWGKQFGFYSGKPNNEHHQLNSIAEKCAFVCLFYPPLPCRL